MPAVAGNDTVLIVEDEPGLASVLAGYFLKAGFES